MFSRKRSLSTESSIIWRKKEETLQNKLKNADEKVAEADRIKKSQLDMLEKDISVHC